MREELSASLLPIARDPRMVFITGDLGYTLFDDLAHALGDRFINAGVAEQNMISVAAGLARAGFRPWVYTIAPFIFARPFEQVRNDVCLHNLPVRLLGNGAGLSYGVLGPTHHAVEDYGVLLTLPNMKVFAPGFDQDVPTVIAAADALPGPCYVRLGRGELPAGEAATGYAPWRRLVDGHGPMLVTTSTLAGSVWDAVRGLPEAERPQVWLVSELPLASIPAELTLHLEQGTPLIVAEEHTRHAGLASILARELMTAGTRVSRLYSLGVDSVSVGAYGNHDYLRKHVGLGADSIRATVAEAVMAR